MKRVKQNALPHRIVEFIPEHLDDGILYISHKYQTASHKCCCGCGEEVVTPLGPTEWSIHIEGGGATLYPSIGNWSYSCRSHYWIRRGRIIWAGDMSQRAINMGREMDRAAKRDHFESVNRGKRASRLLRAINPAPPMRALWSRVKGWWH